MGQTCVFCINADLRMGALHTIGPNSDWYWIAHNLCLHLSLFIPWLGIRCFQTSYCSTDWLNPQFKACSLTYLSL